MNWLFVLAGALIVLIVLGLALLGWLWYVFRDFDEFGY